MKANIKIQKTGANHALPSPFSLPAADLGVSLASRLSGSQIMVNIAGFFSGVP
jgi:hypothetical protein